MIVEPITVRAFRILDAAALDPINVYTFDAHPQAGQLVITCFGRSWSSWWPAMGDRTVAQFVAQCDTGYLVNCLLRGNQELITKQSTRNNDERYLTRIMQAVKEVLVQPRAATEAA